MTNIKLRLLSYLMACCLAFIPTVTYAQVNPEIANCEEIQDEATKTQAEFCSAHLGCRMILKAHTACVKVKSFLQGVRRAFIDLGSGQTREDLDLDSVLAASRPVGSSIVEKTPKAVPLISKVSAYRADKIEMSKSTADVTGYRSQEDQEGRRVQYDFFPNGQVTKLVFDKDGTLTRESVNSANNALRLIAVSNRSYRGWKAAENQNMEMVGDTYSDQLINGSMLDKSTFERREGIWSGETKNQFLSGYIHTKDGQKTRFTSKPAEQLYQDAQSSNDRNIRQQYLAAMLAEYPGHALTAKLQSEQNFPETARTLPAAPVQPSAPPQLASLQSAPSAVPTASVIPAGKVGVYSSICMRNLEKVHEPIKKGRIAAPQDGQRFWKDVYELYFAILRPCAAFDDSAKSEIEWRTERLQHYAQWCKGADNSTTIASVCSEWGSDPAMNKTWYNTFLARAREAIADPLNYSGSIPASSGSSGARNFVCDNAYAKLEADMKAAKGRQPNTATTIQQLRLILWMTDQAVRLGKGACKGSARESELMARQAEYDSSYKACVAIATTPGVCLATVP